MRGRAMLVFGLLPALAAAAPPDSNEIVHDLALPKPSAADLSGPARGIRAVPPATTRQIDLAIPFATGAATVAPSGASLLDALGHALASPQLADDAFRIEGHADTVGDAAANLTLSQHRAEAVSAILSNRYGIDPSRLKALGVGSNELVVQTPDQTPEARNRVVRVVNLGAQK